MPLNVGHGIIPGLVSGSTFQELSINASSTGDNTIIAGVANQTIRIFRFFFVTSAATNVTIKNGTTALTGAMSMGANGGFTLDFQSEAWFHTSAGNDFIFNQSGSAVIGGRIYFQQS